MLATGCDSMSPGDETRTDAMRTRSAFTVTGLISECFEYAAIRVACHYSFHLLNRGAVDLKLQFLMPSTPTAMISTVDRIVLRSQRFGTQIKLDGCGTTIHTTIQLLPQIGKNNMRMLLFWGCCSGGERLIAFQNDAG